MRILLCVLVLSTFTACSRKDLVERIANPAKQRIAMEYIERLRSGSVTELASELDASLKTGNETAQLQQVRAVIPPLPPKKTQLVGYWVWNSGGVTTYNVTFELGYESQWLVVNAAWKELPNGNRTIMGLAAQPVPEPLEVTHAFTFRRARAQHYVFLAAAIIVPVFCLVTLVACARTSFARRKWLWVVFVSVGFCQLSLNWTTGQISFAPLSFLLFGVGAFAPSLYSPWVVSVGFPIGAIVFWVKRKSFGATTPRPPQLNPPPQNAAPKPDTSPTC